MERILEIKETTFSLSENSRQSFDGFVIKTDQQEIKFGISNGQECCEDWGYFSSEDDFSEFINAEIIGIDLTDSGLNDVKIEEAGVTNACMMFVTIKTTQGVLQFTAYNYHNGYYSHDAVFISNQLTETDFL